MDKIYSYMFSIFTERKPSKNQDIHTERREEKEKKSLNPKLSKAIVLRIENHCNKSHYSTEPVGQIHSIM